MNARISSAAVRDGAKYLTPSAVGVIAGA